MPFSTRNQTTRAESSERAAELWLPDEFFQTENDDSRIFASEKELVDYIQLLTGCDVWVRPYRSYGSTERELSVFGSIFR